MEAVGQIIVSLHRNLEEIRAQIDHGGKDPNSREGLLLQSTIDRAEAALRSQARELLAGAAVSGGGGSSGSSAAALPLARSPGPGAYPGGGLPLPPPRSQHSPVPPVHVASSPDSIKPPIPRQRPVRAPARGARSRAKTTQPHRLLPKPNRLDPLADPPAITERDLQGGLQSLTQRGFIPPGSDLTPAMERGMPVLGQRPALLHDSTGRHERREVATADDMTSVRMSYSAPAKQLAGGSTRASTQSPRQEVRSARQLPPLQPLSPAPVTLALPAPPQAYAGPSAVADNYGTFCTELLDAAPDTDTFITAFAMAPEPAKPREDEVRGWAVTLIAAAWRGVLERRRFRQRKRADRAARRIQSCWAVALTRMVTKQRLHDIREEERKLHTRLLYELGQDWFQAKQMRRVEVHICSLTLHEDRRRNCEGYQALQAAQIARIFRLMDPKRDIIFVAPKLLHEDILDYYAKIMQLRGVRNPPGRFQVVVPENMDLHHSLSLTQGLLCSPKALKRIRKLVQGKCAYVVPEVVTHSELKLTAQLQLPLLGAGPRNMALLNSKSNGKKLAQLAELPIGPWAVDIYDKDEFFTSLAGLIVKHPEVKMWLFKIDDERDARGHAYIDLTKFPALDETLRASVEALDHAGGGSALAALMDADEDGDGQEMTGSPMPHQRPSIADEEPGTVGANATEVRALLQRHVPKKAVMCNRRAYPDFAAWMAEASRVGAVIQAVPDNIVSQTAVHIQVDPDGYINVVGTSETVTAQPFVRAASWFPHTRGNWEVLKETGLRAGRALAAKGLVGFASVDVVFFENPSFDASLLEDPDREPTPVVIGNETPVDPQHLMFMNLRSPSPAMTDSSAGGRMSRASNAVPPSLPESRQADYNLALQVRDGDFSARPSTNPVDLMLGSAQAGHVGAQPTSHFACWIVDIDARLTDEAVALFPLQFVAQVKLEQSTGLLRQNRPEGAEVPPEDNTPERSQRWALVTHVAEAPGMDRMNYQSLFQVAKMKGVSFDLFHNIGCLFAYLDVFAGLFSALAVDRTAEACARRLSTAVSAIAEGSQKTGGASTGRAKVAAPRDAPLPPGKSASEASDSLCITDVQMALRLTMKRWVESQKRTG